MSGFRELSGKHIVITGANSGIGKCMLNRLRDLGAVIVAADKDTLDIEEATRFTLLLNIAVFSVSSCT